MAPGSERALTILSIALNTVEKPVYQFTYLPTEYHLSTPLKQKFQEAGTLCP